MVPRSAKRYSQHLGLVSDHAPQFCEVHPSVALFLPFLSTPTGHRGRAMPGMSTAHRGRAMPGMSRSNNDAPQIHQALSDRRQLRKSARSAQPNARASAPQSGMCRGLVMGGVVMGTARVGGWRQGTQRSMACVQVGLYSRRWPIGYGIVLRSVQGLWHSAAVGPWVMT